MAANQRITVNHGDPTLAPFVSWVLWKKPDGTYDKMEVTQQFDLAITEAGPYIFWHTVIDPGDVTAPGFEPATHYPLPDNATFPKNRRMAEVIITEHQIETNVNFTNLSHVNFNYAVDPAILDPNVPGREPAPVPIDCENVLSPGEFMGTDNSWNYLRIVDTSSIATPTPYPNIISGSNTPQGFHVLYEPNNGVIITAGPTETIRIYGLQAAGFGHNEMIWETNPVGTPTGIKWTTAPGTFGDGIIYFMTDEYKIITYYLGDPTNMLWMSPVEPLNVTTPDWQLNGASIAGISQYGTESNLFAYQGNGMLYFTNGGGTMYQVDPTTFEVEYMTIPNINSSAVGVRPLVIIDDVVYHVTNTGYYKWDLAWNHGGQVTPELIGSGLMRSLTLCIPTRVLLANLGSSVKTVSNQAPAVGDTITYTVVVNNGGGLDATAIFLKDPLATGLTFTGNVTGGTGDPTDGTGIDVGTVPAGGSITVTFDVTVDAVPDPNPFTNTAVLEYDNGEGTPTTNDITGQAIDVPIPPTAVLGTSTKTVSNDVPFTGDTITYTINFYTITYNHLHHYL